MSKTIISAPKVAPLVSVILPVFNGEEFLRAGLDSILGQSLTDFELLVIDDASRDGTAQLLRSYDDKRLKILRQSRNVGPAQARNIGLAAARGRFIALLDADDIAYPDRLLEQTSFLESRREICVLGGAIDIFGQTEFHRDYPLTDAELKGAVLFHAPFAHPFVMFRGEFVRRNGIRYNEKYRVAEDYELWLRLAHYDQPCAFANLAASLGRYRLHPENSSTRLRQLQITSATRAQYPYLTRLCGKISKEELTAHSDLYENCFPVSGREEFLRKKAWLLRLKSENARQGYYPTESFNKSLAEKFHGLCVKNIRLGLWVYEELLAFPDLPALGLTADKLELLHKTALQIDDLVTYPVHRQRVK